MPLFIVDVTMITCFYLIIDVTMVICLYLITNVTMVISLVPWLIITK